MAAYYFTYDDDGKFKRSLPSYLCRRWPISRWLTILLMKMMANFWVVYYLTYGKDGRFIGSLPSYV